LTAFKREIVGPGRGERIVFLKTAEETGGAFLEFEHYIQPGKGYSPDHIHVDQDEKYEIVSGVATYTIEGVEKTVQAGETVIISKNTNHVNPWNKTGTDVLQIHRVTTPEGGAQLFFTTWYALDRADGKNLEKPSLEMNPFQISVIAQYLPAKTFISRFPLFLQKIGLPLLALIGRLFGYKVRYPELE
jgi:hypothetical protein